MCIKHNRNVQKIWHRDILIAFSPAIWYLYTSWIIDYWAWHQQILLQEREGDAAEGPGARFLKNPRRNSMLT